MVNSIDKTSNLNILVTGGAGFLGKAIVHELLDSKSPINPGEIRIIDTKEYLGKKDDRIHFIKGDICNFNDIDQACRGIDLVIHSAAIVDWGTKLPEEVYRVNYTGTQNVIGSCKKNNVRMLVYTSSLDTVINGKPLVNINETMAYPAKHPNMYCKSKFMAERLVMKENNEKLKTCVLRPSDIYGEEDPYHLQPLIDMAKGGFYIRIGNGKAKSQHVYVRNIAWAHILAAKALVNNNSRVLGNVYFITDSAGSNFFTFFDKIVAAAGYRIWPKNLWLPRWPAYMLGAISEFIAIIVRPVKYYNPKLSRFAVLYTCTDFTFTSEKAKKDFGFFPKYSEEEAFNNTVAYFKK
ncbi:MAG: NAD-dependent epimerase/dehydratase family protein [Bacteroidales bacterium]|nr:NAD-dependent epimerase/dehydratase family protein [Bacteroidales bacterium]